MKLLRYLRSMDTIPKWLIFVSLTGSTWFFGQESWFRWYGWKESSGSHWEWVFFWTSIVALVTYWVLFDFKGSDEK